jgi:hypothetical protein
MSGLSREQYEALASTIASVRADSPDSFFARIAVLLKEHGVELPCVRVDYNHLNCVVDATSSAAALPSLPNILSKVFKVC